MLVYMLAIAGRLGVVAPPSEPNSVPIVAGDEVATCGWPSAVALLVADDDEPSGLGLRCSATLISESVVLTAAHCISDAIPIVAVGFGEAAPPWGEPARTVGVTSCEIPPEAEPPGSVNTVKHDVAVCRLAEPVDDVPIVPLISACELDAVTEGAEVVIVGYGATVDIPGQFVGGGRKRTATQTIDTIDTSVWNNVQMFDLEGPAACSGDSGGPAFVRLDDGSWRVFGTGSSTYLPAGAVPPRPADNGCWAGSVYGFAGLFLPWLTEAAGAPLTCHDLDDAWDPAAPCDPLPFDPAVADPSRTWAAGCAGGPVVDAPVTCEGAAGSTGGDDTGSPGTDDGDTTSAAPADATDDDGDGTSTGGTTSSPSGATSTAGDDDTSGGPPDADDDADGDAGGCGCTSRPRDAAGPTGLLAWILFTWRRRRSTG